MDTRSMIAVVALGVASLGLLLAFTAHRRLTAARRGLVILQSNFEGKTLVDALATYVQEVKSFRNDLEALERSQADLFDLLGQSKRNLGVVRYDAFEDMGGRMSFSAAVLDDHGSGVVLTAINGRHEARVYAKQIENGTSEHNLSKDEQQAIEEALGYKPRVQGRR